MFTPVPSATAVDFDLSESIVEAWPAIVQAYPDWSIEEQTGLAAAIRHDAEAFVAANDPAPETLATIEARMLGAFLSALPDESRSEPDDAEPAIPVPLRMIDLAAEVGEIAPFLDSNQRHLLAGEVYFHLEILVGESLSEGMSDALLDEFGHFVDKDVEGMDAWFAANLPGYEADEGFQRLLLENPEASRVDVVAEFGAMRWLAKNRPHYPQVVAQEVARLKEALAGLVAQVGEDAIRNWARTQGEWADMLRKAEGERGVIRCAALLVDFRGAEAVERWAFVEKQLLDLDKRVDTMGGAR